MNHHHNIILWIIATYFMETKKVQNIFIEDVAITHPPCYTRQPRSYCTILTRCALSASLTTRKGEKPTEPEEKQYQLRSDKQDVERKKNGGGGLWNKDVPFCKTTQYVKLITIVLATKRKSKTGH